MQNQQQGLINTNNVLIGMSICTSHRSKWQQQRSLFCIERRGNKNLMVVRWKMEKKTVFTK